MLYSKNKAQIQRAMILRKLFTNIIGNMSYAAMPLHHNISIKGRKK